MLFGCASLRFSVRPPAVSARYGENRCHPAVMGVACAVEGRGSNVTALTSRTGYRSRLNGDSNDTPGCQQAAVNHRLATTSIRRGGWSEGDDNGSYLPPSGPPTLRSPWSSWLSRSRSATGVTLVHAGGSRRGHRGAGTAGEERMLLAGPLTERHRYMTSTL